MKYSTYHIQLSVGKKLDIVAISIEAAISDIKEAYSDVEVLTYSITE